MQKCDGWEIETFPPSGPSCSWKMPSGRREQTVSTSTPYIDVLCGREAGDIIAALIFLTAANGREPSVSTESRQLDSQRSSVGLYVCTYTYTPGGLLVGGKTEQSANELSTCPTRRLPLPPVQTRSSGLHMPQRPLRGQKLHAAGARAARSSVWGPRK